MIRELKILSEGNADVVLINKNNQVEHQYKTKIKDIQQYLQVPDYGKGIQTVGMMLTEQPAQAIIKKRQFKLISRENPFIYLEESKWLTESR